MNEWISKALGKARALYQFTEEAALSSFGIPVSEDQLNAVLYRYVTNKVNAITELKAELLDHDFHLTIGIAYKGVYLKATGRFSVISFVFNDTTQRMVFLQKTPTEVLELRADQKYKAILASTVIGLLTKVARRDPTGVGIEYFRVGQVKGDLIYIDVGQYFDEDSPTIKRLQRFQIFHGLISKGRLYLRSRINLEPWFHQGGQIITSDDDPNAHQ